MNDQELKVLREIREKLSALPSESRDKVLESLMALQKRYSEDNNDPIYYGSNLGGR